MSIPDNRSTDECKYCGEELGQFHSPGYCSPECQDKYNRQKNARGVLTTIKHDHRYCATCFSKLKEIERPPPERWGVPDCVVGYEYATEHSETGEKTVSVDEYGKEKLASSGLICRCGNTHHSQSDDILQTRFAFESAVALRMAISDLRREGKTELTVNDVALDAALCEHLLATKRSPQSPDSVDWEIVLAAALE